MTNEDIASHTKMGTRKGSSRNADRSSNLSFRAMASWFRLADFFFPRRDRLRGFGIRLGQTVVDYGCGPGRYVAEASRLVGPAGAVYAVDVHELAIAGVRRKIAQHGLPNVIAVLAEGYASGLPDHCADVVYALDMFHGVSDPAALLAELHRIAKPNGTLFLEDGHQPRERTKEKLVRSGLWRIEAEERSHVRCVPVGGQETVS